MIMLPLLIWYLASFIWNGTYSSLFTYVSDFHFIGVEFLLLLGTFFDDIVFFVFAYTA